MNSRYFTEQELACQHCGATKFDEDFLALLSLIRKECNFPFIVSSAYRCKDHPIEARKNHSGEHSTGMAIDIACSGEKALQLVTVALKHGIKRIGIQQKGSGRFIHLGYSTELPTPAIWSY
tara:strand:+ start:2978 stop:3340 length:363 start_codon:yes stop_codon:yes gene_type:complete